MRCRLKQPISNLFSEPLQPGIYNIKLDWQDDAPHYEFTIRVDENNELYDFDDLDDFFNIFEVLQLPSQETIEAIRQKIHYELYGVRAKARDIIPGFMSDEDLQYYENEAVGNVKEVLSGGTE